MMSKESVVNYILQFSKEYKTEEVLNQLEKDLEKVNTIHGIIPANKIEGYKEISLVTTPNMSLRYKLYKR